MKNINCIYGACVDEDILLGRNPDFNSVEEIVSSNGLNYQRTPSGELIVGKHPNLVGDNQTGKQFREKIKQDISKMIKNEVDCSLYENCWYNE